MQRNLTLAAAILLLAVGAAAWMLLAKPVRLDDELSGPTEVDRLDWPDMRLDLNTVTADELTLLPGIGPALAEAIIAFRSQRGRINSIDELMDVPGIGEGRLAAIEAHVVVDPAD